MGRHVVAGLGDIPEGGRIIVAVESQSIGVFRIDGRYYALGNVCPHQQGPVCTGKVLPTLRARILPNGRIKEYYDRENPVVCCPWHGWEYDVKTGRCVGDPERHLRVYETALEDNKIVIVT